MSFSSDVKEEVSKLNTFKDRNVIIYELIGYLITNNRSIVKNSSAKITGALGKYKHVGGLIGFSYGATEPKESITGIISPFNILSLFL